MLAGRRFENYLTQKFNKFPWKIFGGGEHLRGNFSEILVKFFGSYFQNTLGGVNKDNKARCGSSLRHYYVAIIDFEHVFMGWVGTVSPRCSASKLFWKVW